MISRIKAADSSGTTMVMYIGSLRYLAYFSGAFSNVCWQALEQK